MYENIIKDISNDIIVIKMGYAACGLFSYIIRAMHSMYYFYPKKIYVDWTENFSYQNFPGQNVWDVLFYQPDIDSIDNINNIIITYGNEDANGKILSKDDFLTDANGTPHWYPTEMDRIRAKKLIDEKIILKTHLYNKILNFYYNNISGKKCIAVHRRGANYLHSNPITNEKFNNNLLKVLFDNNYTDVFLCSDNYISKQDVSTFLVSNGINVISYNSHISKNNMGFGHASIHTKNESDVWDVPGNIAAEDAIIDSYLMSMCDAIYKSCSGVSNYSLFLNPQLVVYDVDITMKYNN